MRFCGSCGVQAGHGQRFCISCGANLHPAAASGRGTPPEPVFAYPVPAAGWPVAQVPPAAEDPGSWKAPPEPDGRRPLVGALVLAGLLVVGGGYVVGDRLLVGDGSPPPAEVAGGEPGPGPAGDADTVDVGEEAADVEAVPPPAVVPAPPPGEVAAPSAGTGPLRPRSVSATCQAPSGVDASGAPVTYDPANTLDGVGGTAWRCAGSAVGQRLVFDFGRPVVLASVGLVPGYDKTDPVDGTDRFGENRTVTAVTWGFDGGTVHRQEIAVPGREMARAVLPGPVTTSRVVLEVAGTGNDGAIRDFTTISDVAFAGSG
ncbi:discoidin domain-containing protein [Blastococcus goldschmidtiae]|uniref:Discoidin domain-containing protein n=1 Tax=Blastococcus goldschmidtiae TaxID=3075546 RepID=A0ABU2K3V1_9ACTN|nr:discoidin domain-containing protein [Blastococcus sp. DSM 46792]MDT0274875.1 discoidin domain-containing protein [Blastococcus sp. DSM 46792]